MSTCLKKKENNMGGELCVFHVVKNIHGFAGGHMCGPVATRMCTCVCMSVCRLEVNGGHHP